MKLKKCAIIRYTFTNKVAAVMIGLESNGYYYAIKCGINMDTNISATIMRCEELNGIACNKISYEDKMIRDMFSSVDLTSNDRIEEFVKDCIYYMDDFTANY